jgi:hypothetical protein
MDWFYIILKKRFYARVASLDSLRVRDCWTVVCLVFGRDNSERACRNR